jgi:hypothetical protein
LAEAFAERGDEVVVASGPEVEEAVAARGLGFRAVSPAFSEWFGALRARTRGVPGDGLDPSRVETYFVPRLFGEIGTALVVDGLLELCRELAPELLVFDPYLFAAPLVAAATGAHPVLHCIGPVMDRSILELVADAVSPIWREFSLPVLDSAGVFSGTTLTICPPSFDPSAAAIAGSEAMRPAPLPKAGSRALPVLFADPGRPLVYMTLGTFSNNDLELFRLVLLSLGDEPVNVLATIGRDNDPRSLGPLPANARVERFIPQADVLGHCAAVVHHAGAGTTFGVLAHGLASLALPQSADNFKNATLLGFAGAAQVLMPGEVTPESVRSGVRAVLGTARYRDCARLLAGEIRAMAPPSDIAGLLAARHSRATM